MAIKISDIDQELIDLKTELENGNISAALSFLNSFQEDWNSLKDILDAFCRCDIKF
ncbi:hypothetical protein [Clostridium butyricum]|uniref:hypothetical protein n=1 Tax=Clostridium butyricum TaxID=1492 RepID=UPI000909B34A|nr:hypothetical protein [Clostridium butyricum]APF21151.1 hypothetical protein NPD4_3490 [Clostridium butyricum]